MTTDKLRNIAIIAHVDHGKTTLVDGLLKQAGTFAAHEAEMDQTTILDKNDLERERGVTILSKNISVSWKEHKINILDTPGHADFSGEVERVLNMAEGCILLVDAAEGVLSQTRYVLGLALQSGLKPIVVINKVDRKDQRADEVENEVSDLFLDLADDESQLDFPIFYAIARDGVAGTKLEANSDHSLRITDSETLAPLYDAIIETIPAPSGDAEGPFQMQVTNIDHDQHKGRYAIGKVHRGTLTPNVSLAVVRKGEVAGKGRVEYVFEFQGLLQNTTQQAILGDIIAIAGFKDIQIGDTMTDPESPEGLPDLSIAEPTMQIEISVSDSPLVGREGEFSTARQIGERLRREMTTNVSLKIEAEGEKYRVSGRGELHLSVLIETMRREGYEFSVSRPQVIFKEIDGKTCEPYELVTVEVPEEHQGFVIQAMGTRKGDMQNMTTIKSGLRMEFKIATRNIIGFRSELLSATSGLGIMHSQIIGYEPKGPDVQLARNGAIMASEPGKALAYSLKNVQSRATTFIDPGTEVYRGMIVGQNSRTEEMYMNVIKGKKLTNMRAASGDDIIKLAPARHLSLEQSLTFLADDELLEVTPQNLRLRKRNLNAKA